VVAVAAAAVAISGTLAGCSTSPDEEPAESTTSEPTPTEEPTPSEEPTPTEPTPTTPSTSSSTPPPSQAVSPTATGAPASTPAGALLSAAEMPQLNDSSTWTERRTGPAGQQPFGLCQQFDLLTIGALNAVERTFTSGTSGTDTAGQQVAEFPDAQNAVRASKVIEAWQRECKNQVKGTKVKVRPITDVPVAQGQAWNYLVSYQRRGEGQFHSLGMVLSGTRMSLIRIDHVGQDHNYEPGQDPMELAVEAVSARLGGA